MSNNITISGSLTGEPELKFTKAGKALCSFSVRVVTGKKQEGEEFPPAAFFDVTAWEKLAENVAESLQKGDRVIVSGRITQNNWEDKEGNKRSKLQIQASEVGADLSYAVVTVEQNERSGRTPRAEAKIAEPEW
jgi:single-strand DNA-binding protein